MYTDYDLISGESLVYNTLIIISKIHRLSNDRRQAVEMSHVKYEIKKMSDT